jgi:hypothetical protein
MKKIYLLLVLVILFNQISAQKCYADLLKHRSLSNNIDLIDSVNKIEEFTKNFSSSNRSVVTIPVVIHVVWNQQVENISLTQIQSQIDVLNEDFRGTNPDTMYVPNDFYHLIADCEIEFCLASFDTNGNPTNGVVRTQTNIQSIGDPDVHGSKVQHSSQGGSDAWDPNYYLNIWVASFGSAATLGYAYYPGTAPQPNEDGAVIDYRKFGTTGTVVPPNDYGRTVTHEIGHYFNLKHVWGDNGGCTDDDLVNDTPMQDSANYGTPNHPDYSCGTADMFMNFMDYVDDDYMNMFSVGQKQRMLAALNGPRASLLNSPGCNGQSAGKLELTNSEEITLFPNPVNNLLTVDFTGKNDKLVNYTIYSLSGKELIKDKLITNKINLSEIQKGSYFIRFKTSKNQIITKQIQKI